MVRDYVVARVVWRCLIEPELVSEFFSVGQKEWMLWILRMGSIMSARPRRTKRVATVCWMQWGWRNEELFNGVWLDMTQRLKQVFDSFEKDEVFYLAEDLRGLELRRNASYGLV